MPPARVIHRRVWEVPRLKEDDQVLPTFVTHELLMLCIPEPPVQEWFGQ